YCGYAEKRRRGTYAANKPQQSPYFETKLAHLFVKNYIHMFVHTVAEEGHLNEQSVVCISWRNAELYRYASSRCVALSSQAREGQSAGGKFFPSPVFRQAPPSPR
ncbi:hypothetical protein MHYP_G00115420, partial [Metynnis hypsauchen]